MSPRAWFQLGVLINGALLAVAVFAYFRVSRMLKELRRMTDYPNLDNRELVRILRDILATRRAMRLEGHRFPDEVRRQR